MFLFNSYRFGRNRVPLPFSGSRPSYGRSFINFAREYMTPANALWAYQTYKRLRSEL